MTKKSFIKTIGEKGLLADYNTEGKKLQTELTAGDNVTIANNVISSNQVFVATYGTTTYQEIKDAYDAGKVCLCKKGDVITMMYADTRSNFRFFTVNAITKAEISFQVSLNNVWTTITNNVQSKLTFDTAPTAGSNNPVTSDGIKKAIDEVNNSLDAKEDADKVVAIADAVVARTGQKGSGWYKLAELTANPSNDNVNYCFDVYAATDSKKFAGRLDVAIRTGKSVGTSVGITLKKFYSDAWLSAYKFKIAIRGLTGSATIELWASCLRSFGGIAISERNTSSYTATNRKGRWTYTSYVNNGGSAAPVTDATNNVQVEDVDVVYRQLAIVSPTDNNLVAMDANGLVKDSGKSASDFATKAELNSRIPVPTSTTGTQVLKCINGVLQWVTE